MYNRYSRRDGSFFQAFFWVLVGFMLGQMVRLDIGIAPRPSALQPIQNTVYLEE